MYRVEKRSDGFYVEAKFSDLVNQLKSICTFENPKHKMHRFFVKYGRNPHSPTINFFRQTDCGKYFVFPRNVIVNNEARLIIEKNTIINTSKDCFERVSLGEPINMRSDAQRMAVNSMVDSFLLNKKDGLLVAPTGSGKTVMMLEVARRLGLPTLWITHRRALMYQGADRARQFLKCEPGFIGDGLYEVKPLTFCVVQSLMRRNIEEISSYFGTVIVDEAHLFGAESYIEQVQYFKPLYLMGTTATAGRKDGLWDLVKYSLGEPVHYFEEKDAGIMNPEVNILKMPDGLYLGSDLNAIKKELVANKARNNKIAEKIIEIIELKKSKMIVFCINVKHLEIIKSLIKAARPSLVVESIQAKTTTKQREDILKRANNGSVDVLLTIKIAREGLDIPIIDTGFHTSPHDDEFSLKQEVGRIRRIHPNKVNCSWYDCVDVENKKLKKAASNRFNLYKLWGFNLIRKQ